MTSSVGMVPSDDRALAPATLVTALCVTEDRPAFLPWLLWNYDKQDHHPRRLVVVDSSHDLPPLPDRPDIQVLRCDPGTPVAVKRNLALRAAEGDAVTWFDDDDWQSPRKLSLLALALRSADVAGAASGWFVDLDTGRSRPYVSSDGPVFNSLGVRRPLAAAVPFDERRLRASDTPWLARVRRQPTVRVASVDAVLFFWLRHDANLSNPSSGRPCRQSLAAVRSAVGEQDWGETEAELSRLRARLSGARAGQRLTVPAVPRTAARRAGLCVVVTTYDRPDGLARLLEDLDRECDGTVEVRVYDDGTPRGHEGVGPRLAQRGGHYVRAGHNHGKTRWWQWWNTILADLRRCAARSFLVLQDDMRLCPDFLERSLALWDGIRDERKGSLFLHLDESAVSSGRSGWTTSQDVQAGRVVRCGWVDMNAFICDRRLFEALDWHLRPVPGRRWSENPLLGSGVGAQISVRAHQRGLGLYRVRESLTVHDSSPSRMNPRARDDEPLTTVRFVDGDAAAERLAQPRPFVTASLASVPSRADALERVAAALLPQVDRLTVHLNGYRRVPDWLTGPRTTVTLSQDHGDLGDAGKLLWADAALGTVLLCDDDLRYPRDYVTRLLSGLERYGGRAAVGFHGALLAPRVTDYLRSRRVLHFSRGLLMDTPVHVLGTGVSAYRSSALRLAVEDVTPGLADVCVAVAGQRQRVPFVCLAHDAGWLTELPGTFARSYYARALSGDGPERDQATRLVQREQPWRLHAAAPGSTAVRPAPAPAASPGRGPTMVDDPVHAADPVMALRPVVPVSVRGPTTAVRLLLPADDHITRAVQTSGTYYERDLLDAIRELGPLGTYVDVGAHFGNHTVFFAVECAAERVVAIEPHRHALDGLRVNAGRNDVAGRVSALHLAIHPTARHVAVTALPWRARPGRGVLTNSGRVGISPVPTGGVAAVPLDEALQPYGHVGLVKVDVEGLGSEVLASGARTLERDRPVVAVEAASEVEQERVRQLLVPLGYALRGRFCWTPTWLWSAGG